jgi:hypothetical protein
MKLLVSISGLHFFVVTLIAAFSVFGLSLIAWSPAAAAGPRDPSPIAGRWQYKDGGGEITADFNGDGTFHQVMRSAFGTQQVRGRWTLTGQVLQLMAEGGYPPQMVSCSFVGPDTMVLAYPTGQVLTVQRVASAAPSASGPAPPTPAAVQDRPHPSAAPDRKPKTIRLQPVWEPNERAFSVLVPRGWKTVGGVFNVNPLKMNGPGNTLSPKCDFAVKSDDAGTVMLHWMPSWNYADLSLSPSGWGLFRPGQYYQGMPAKPMASPRQFLTQLIQAERPRASGLKFVAEDPMPEVADAYAQKAQAVNQQLMQAGIAPTTFQCLAMLAEYQESGRLFRERVAATIADARASAFMWTNDDTVMFRAPADEFESWKPVLDMFLSSRQMNPQWLAAVHRAMGERARNALETQQYINRVASEIVENRRRTHAEIRHESWLFISGQEEYQNPYTGQVELGTSAYRHRWVNEQGEVLYSDENGFDPNQTDAFKAEQWKRSEVRKR